MTMSGFQHSNFHWLIAQLKRIATILISSFILILVMLPLILPIKSYIVNLGTEDTLSHSAIIYDTSCSPYGSLSSCVEVLSITGE